MAERLWWYKFAACHGQSGLFFTPESYTPRTEAARVAQAKKVCDGCPVASVCLDYALGRPERAGVWGGTTPDERTAIQHRIRRQQRRLAG